MSLFSSLQVAGNSLRATQIGMQVVGQNIANANTPGYIREEMVQVPAPTQQIGLLQMGLGVEVQGIVQKVDNLLEQRLRNAISDRAATETEEQTFQQLESLTSDLGDTGLGKTLSDFVNSVHDVLNQPENAQTRNLAVLRGQTLASQINGLSERSDQIRTDLSQQSSASLTNVNRLIRQIADLNVRIAKAEGGNSLQSAAVGLRDQRYQALSDLAQEIDINVQDQKNGMVTVYVGGDFLVFGDESREVALEHTNQGDELRLVDNHALLQPSSGKLLGLTNSRDQIVGAYKQQLDEFARTLAFEFNRLHTSGQGLQGYHQLTSNEGVTDANSPLDAAGLPYTATNGSFEFQLYDRKTGLTTTTNITVDLNGLDHDTTLTDLSNQLNAITGVTASIDATGKLSIASSSQDQDFAFANDTSGILAAIGINTFFTGTSAGSLGVNAYLKEDSSKFAASRGGIGADTANAIDLAGFLDRPLESRNNSTISQIQQQIVADTTQRSAETSSVAEGNRVFESSLKGQSLAVSGVNIDEETIKLLAYQRTFQISAKFISTVNSLMDTLINL